MRSARHLAKRSSAHQTAVERLSAGSGHLVGQVEKLRKMGIQTKKELPLSFPNREERGERRRIYFGKVNKSLREIQN